MAKKKANMPDMEVFRQLSERGFSLIRLNGKDPSKAEGARWQKYCNKRRPFDQIPFKKGQNAGVACGPASGVIVLDIDNLDKWLPQKVELPETFTVQTGRGLFHHYFKYPDNGRKYGCTSRKSEGFDIKGHGGQVVSAGSIHPDTGKPYVIFKDLPLADSPQWILDLVEKEEEEKSKNIDAGTGEEIDIDSLPVSDKIKDLISDPPLKGDRSEAIMSAVNALVAADVDPETIYSIFEQSPIGKKYREKGLSRRKWLRDHIKKAKEYVKEDKAKPEEFTVAELMRMDFPDPVWVVEPILPEGVCLLTGKPKVGKTWLVLSIGAAKGFGGKALSSIQVTKGRVLILALEDSKRRLQSRFNEILQGEKPTEMISITTTWPRAGKGGLKLLDDWLTKHEDAAIVIIDTLERFRPKRGKQFIYEADYEALSGLQGLASKHKAAILVVHHLRKSEAEDWLDTISGSTGLSGAADTIIRLVRDRGAGQVDAILNIIGRDVEETDLALRFDITSKSWQLLGNAEEIASTRDQQKIIDLLAEDGEALKLADIALLVGKKLDATSKMLRRLKKKGLVTQPKYGFYKTTTYTSPTSPSSPSDTNSPSDPTTTLTSAPKNVQVPKPSPDKASQGSWTTLTSYNKNPRQTYPNPVRCRADGCKWLQWPETLGVKDKWEAVCVIAAMTGRGVNVPDKKNKKYMTDRIVRMSFCPLSQFEKKASE
jgi:hypothetical protein